MFTNSEAVCRACLQSPEQSNLISLHDNNFRRSFERCSSLSVSDDDAYPKSLCSSCWELVRLFDEFKLKCIASQHKWDSYLTSKSDVEEKFQPTSPENDISENITSYDCEEETAKVIAKKIEPKNDNDNSYKEDHIWILNTVKRNSFKGQCNLCQKMFYYKSSLIKHLQRCGAPKDNVTAKPTDQDYLFCGICVGKFESMEEVGLHLERHLDSGDLVCQICGHVAVDFADLLVHRFYHQPSGKKLKKCCFRCPQRYYKLDRLEFHFRGAHLALAPGVCKVCSARFHNYNHLLVHRLTHTGQVFRCDACDKTFKYEKSLTKHRSVHSTQRPFMCHMCDYTSRWHTGLKSHIFHKHQNHQEIMCSHCGKTFKNKVTLRQHILQVQGEKNHTCTVCYKKFKSEPMLAQHVKWHSDVKPYSCNMCGLSYKAKGHLKSHMRIHTGEKPYVCSVCCMRFPYSNTLKRHMLTHTGEKRYDCPVCGKKFAASNNMRKHAARHKVLDKQ